MYASQHLATWASEVPEGHGGSEASDQKWATHGDGLQENIYHLMAVTGAATIAEISDVVAMGEMVIRDFLLEEFT